MNERYSSIIDLPHPTSERHPRMPLSERAAQFAPFAALVGFGAAVDERARLTEGRIELDEYEIERINMTLTELLNREMAPRVAVTYFVKDKRKAGGAYITLIGRIVCVREYMQTLLLDENEIPLDDIINIEEIFDEP